MSNGTVKYEIVSRIPESRVKKRDVESEVNKILHEYDKYTPVSREKKSESEPESLFEQTIDTVGEFSGAYDGYRAIVGVDPKTKEKLSWQERTLSGASVIPVGKWLKARKFVLKANKGAKTVKRVEKAEEVAKDVGKGTKGTDNISDFAKKPFLPDEVYKKSYLNLLNQEQKVLTNMMN
ncbi:pre-toxin TG domain-containing protein [Bacillus changyiensis]